MVVSKIVLFICLHPVKGCDSATSVAKRKGDKCQGKERKMRFTTSPKMIFSSIAYVMARETKCLIKSLGDSFTSLV